jgi:hypothetical protein
VTFLQTHLVTLVDTVIKKLSGHIGMTPEEKTPLFITNGYTNGITNGSSQRPLQVQEDAGYPG